MQADFLSVFSPRPPPPLPHRFLVSHRLSFRAAVSFTSGITKEKTHERLQATQATHSHTCTMKAISYITIKAPACCNMRRRHRSQHLSMPSAQIVVFAVRYIV